jgi:hypothetical protein
MDRRDWLIRSGLAGAGLLLKRHLRPVRSLRATTLPLSDSDLLKADFGRDFRWGVAAAAYQTEGAWRKREDGQTGISSTGFQNILIS